MTRKHLDRYVITLYNGRMKRINAFITDSQWDDLHVQARKLEITFSEALRRSILFWLALCDVSREEIRGPRAIWKTTVMDYLPFSEPPVSTKDDGHVVYDGD